MILVNLIGEEKKLVVPVEPPRANPHALPLVAALIGLFFSGALFPHLSEKSAAPRPLFIDEKETVVATFSGLPARVPELAGWIENVKTLYVQGEVPAVLANDDDVKSEGHLLRLEDETLYFSRSFFDSDPKAQEGALLEAVLAIHQDEVAVVGE